MMKIPVDASFSFSECLWFLHRNFDDCLHKIGPDHVRKAILVNGTPVLFELREGLEIKLLNGKKEHEKAVAAFVHEWLDLKRDLSPFYELLAGHEQLAYMLHEFSGLRLVGIPDLFEAICWCIIGQQINLTFAYKIKRRLVERYGQQLIHDGHTYYTFPTPEVLVDADLDGMQLSGRKAEYLREVAKVFRDGKMSKELLLSLTDFTAQQQALTAIRGVGIWTANYTLMKTLRIPSAVPYGDAGLLNGLIKHNLMENKKDLAAQEVFFEYFKGWESYAVFYLWRSLAPKS